MEKKLLTQVIIDQAREHLRKLLVFDLVKIMAEY